MTDDAVQPEAQEADEQQEEQEEREFAVLATGKLPHLKEQLDALERAGIPAQIVRPPEAAVNG